MNIAKAQRLRKGMTDAEQRLWFHLRYRQIDGARFRRQSPIGRYIVDFVCASHSLIVELDGVQHAEQQAAYDAERTRWLESQGYRVLRFWNNDVLLNTEGVLEAILSALRADPPP